MFLNKRFFLFFFYFFFSSSLITSSLEEFLSKEILKDNHNCQELKTGFSKVNNTSENKDFLRLYKLVNKIIKKSCSLSTDEQIFLDQEIRNEFIFGNLDEISVYLFYISDALVPYFKKNEFESIEKVSNYIISTIELLYENQLISIENRLIAYEKLIKDGDLVNDFDFSRKILDALEISLLKDLKNNWRPAEDHKLLAEYMLELRVNKVEYLLNSDFINANKFLIIELKKIFDLYLYDSKLNLKEIPYKEVNHKINNYKEPIKLEFPLRSLSRFARVMQTKPEEVSEFIESKYGDDFEKILTNFLNDFPKFKKEYLTMVDFLIIQKRVDDKGNYIGCNLYQSFDFEDLDLNKFALIDAVDLVRVENRCPYRWGHEKIIESDAFMEYVSDLNWEDDTTYYLIAFTFNSLFGYYIDAISQARLLEEPEWMRENIGKSLYQNIVNVLTWVPFSSNINSKAKLDAFLTLYDLRNPFGAGRYLKKNQLLELDKLTSEKFNYEASSSLLDIVNSLENSIEGAFTADSIEDIFQSEFYKYFYVNFFSGNNYDLSLLDKNRNTNKYILDFENFSIVEKQILFRQIVYFRELAQSTIKKLIEINDYGKKTYQLTALNDTYPYSKNIKSLSSWIIYFNDLLSLDIFKELLDGSYQEAFKGDLDFFLKTFDFSTTSNITFSAKYKKIEKELSEKKSIFLIKEYYDSLIKALSYEDLIVNLNNKKEGESVPEKILRQRDILKSKANSNEIKVLRHLQTNISKQSLENLLFRDEFSLRDLQENLKENETVLLLSLEASAPGLKIFIDKNNIYYETGLDYFELLDQVEKIREEIFSQNRLSGNFDLNVTTKVYEKVFNLPKFSLNKERQKIFVIGDSFLQDLPLALLYNAEDKKYAFERFNFVYLESISHLINLKENFKEERLNKNMKYVAFADPLLKGDDRNTDFKSIFLPERSEKKVNSINSLSRIIDTAEEVTNLSKNFKNSQLFLGKMASEEVLKRPKNKKIIYDADLISFATHTFSSSSNFTNEYGLIFTPPDKPYGQNDGFLTSQEILDLKLNQSTVILSACDTDQPIFLGAPRYSGLIRAFSEAGARNILFTNWNIDSKSAKIFISEAVSEGVKKELSFSEAISLTMKRFVKGDFGEQYKHPYYWAPYQILGLN